MSKHRPNKADKFHQGEYKLKNPNKYLGDPRDIIYRSSWEYKFMLYCDLNEGVLKWGSETIKIPYITRDGHRKNYIPDFYLETVNKNNPLYNNKFLVEVKPEEQTREPVIPKTISEKRLKNLEYQIQQWNINKHKWAFAIEWCRGRGIQFWLVTEQQINSFKP